MLKTVLLKKFLLFGTLMAFAFMIASPATLNAQAKALTDEEEKKFVAALQKETPLTQEDIDAYIKIAPQVKAANKDHAKLDDIFKAAGFNHVRGVYVTAKVHLAQLYLQKPEVAESIMETNEVPNYLRPSTQEIELVKKNLASLPALPEK